MNDFTTGELEWTPSLSAASEHDPSGDDTNTISPLLAFFLQNLLKDSPPIVSIIVDNIRGLPNEKASSYAPPTPSQRLSDSSVPELCRHRWGAESHGEDHSRRLASLAGDMTFDSSDTMESSLTRAPLVPRRRCSIDSLDDISAELLASEAVDEDECCTRGCSDDTYTAGEDRFKARRVRFKGTNIAELDDRDAVVKAQQKTIDNNTNTNTNTKCLRSPPKAPERQASLRHLQCKPELLATNLSIPNEDQLDTAEVQKVHRRRHGVSFLASSDSLTSMLASSHRDGYQPALMKENPALVLEKMYREVCITAGDFDEEDDTEHWDNTAKCDDIMGETSFSRIETQINRDSLPSCAKRRPSPQLDKGSLHGCDSTDASPVRAKRRPSPELEPFASLLEALASVKKQ